MRHKIISACKSIFALKLIEKYCLAVDDFDGEDEDDVNDNDNCAVLLLRHTKALTCVTSELD